MISQLSQNELSAILALTTLAGGLLGWFGRGIGFVLQRRLTGAGRKESVDYLASLTTLMTKLREQGWGINDIREFEVALRGPVLSRSESVAAIVQAEGADEIDAFTTTIAMRSRAAAQFDVADALLKQVVGDLHLVLSEYEQDSAAETHMRWLDYRAALMTAAEVEYEGGTIATLISAYRGIAETERRTAELKAIVAARVARLRNEEQQVARIVKQPWRDEA